MLRVGRHFILMAIKTAGSAQKCRVGRVSGNAAISFYLHLTLTEEWLHPAEACCGSLMGQFRFFPPRVI